MNFLLSKPHNFNDLLSIFGKDYPWLNNLIKTEQDTIWHAEGNVAIHTDMVMKETYNKIKENPDFTDHFKISLILGAFFHDIGKVVTTKEVHKNNRICIGAPGHEETGFNYLYFLINEDERLTSYVDNILQIVGYHHIPKLLVLKNQSYWHYLSYRYKFNPILLYHFAVCDIKGRDCVDKKEQLDYLELFKLQMQEYELWNTTNDFPDKIKDTALFSIYSQKTFDFIYQKALYHLKNEDITMPEEIIPKYYDFIKNGFATVNIISGLSGSGKTTFSNQNFEQSEIISLDNLRFSFSKDLRNRKYEGQVLQLATKLLKEGLANKKDIVYDGTNLRKDFREKIINQAINYNAMYKVHFINTSLTDCIKNDAKRNNSVGKRVILKQVKKIQHPYY